MKFVIILVVLLMSLATPASALYVPADGTTVFVHVAPGWYDVRVWGTYSLSTEYAWAIADAEWVQVVDTWTENCKTWQNNLGDLSINNTFLDWQGKNEVGLYQFHAFSLTHEYRTVIYTEDLLSFWIYDSIYSDNTGGLEVTYEIIPEPSSLIVLGGGLLTLFQIRKKTK